MSNLIPFPEQTLAERAFFRELEISSSIFVTIELACSPNLFPEKYVITAHSVEYQQSLASEPITAEEIPSTFLAVKNSLTEQIMGH